MKQVDVKRKKSTAGIRRDARPLGGVWPQRKLRNPANRSKRKLRATGRREARKVMDLDKLETTGAA